MSDAVVNRKPTETDIKPPAPPAPPRATSTRMTISLPGVLLRAADRCEGTRDAKHLGFPLRQLLDHLRELRKEPGKVQEFFDLWTD